MEPVSTDNLLQLIGVKEVELLMLKQQLQALNKENAELKSKLSEGKNVNSH